MLFYTPKRQSLSIPFPQVFINKSAQARAEYILEKSPQIMREAYQEGTKRFAKIILSIVRKAIATGMPPLGSGVSWPPLAERTLKLYNKWGYPKAHPWYVIGEMHRMVNIFRNSKGNYYVGFPRGVTATNPNPKGQSNNRPTLAKLSTILESSGDNHTSRPLWNPAFKAAGGKERLIRFIIQDLRKKVRSLRGVTFK